MIEILNFQVVRLNDGLYKKKERTETDIFGMMFKSGIQRTLTKQTFRGALIEVYLSKYSNLSTEFSTNNTTNKYLNNLKLIFFKL